MKFLKFSAAFCGRAGNFRRIALCGEKSVRLAVRMGRAAAASPQKLSAFFSRKAGDSVPRNEKSARMGTFFEAISLIKMIDGILRFFRSKLLAIL